MFSLDIISHWNTCSNWLNSQKKNLLIVIKISLKKTVGTIILSWNKRSSVTIFAERSSLQMMRDEWKRSVVSTERGVNNSDFSLTETEFYLYW